MPSQKSWTVMAGMLMALGLACASAEAQAVKKAGSVTGAIPAETVERQGQGAPAPLAVHDAVNWQDVVETQQTGRVRISLLDGSVLNVGARSTMRIVEHNPQTQQTQVELTLGRVRGQVVKLSKPGASFQLKTQTAVIGVVGTIFVVEATATSTHVTCIEGRVAVQNINAAIQGQVQLGPGQATTVEAGAAPTAAAAATASEVQTAMQQTEVAPTPPGVPGAPPGGQAGTTAAGAQATGAQGAAGAAAGGAGAGISVGTAATVAASAASAVAGVTALSKTQDAANAINQANTALQSATSTANAATTAINEANTPVIPPPTPCGCGP
jgi:hypothetical protein